MREMLANLWLDQCGVTAIEYGLLAALIAVVCVTVWTTVGQSLNNTFSTVASDL